MKLKLIHVALGALLTSASLLAVAQTSTTPSGSMAPAGQVPGATVPMGNPKMAPMNDEAMTTKRTGHHHHHHRHHMHKVDRSGSMQPAGEAPQPSSEAPKK
ncbi:MAG: hypothetical protein M3Y55_05140 [Pseudomonadota bacterium]|nr:hypothetical protein [Pseudomonadota bacterium]MDQ2763502.1 hypothetical protein [Pseudomonadota bacterium]